ncbi:hypothetical protein PILCRDRAFT_821690 [Piloderma croceum F 1598]|uniref:Uncharacterized protein n=1 Tax=Piloderma croceum (strain F 1598) TaxID=765440 RepID=A0A0C3FPY0_PILCF|nr:hypothetical protein PILCRDRAFT_821690 [Piloderma croceum F 1598]
MSIMGSSAEPTASSDLRYVYYLVYTENGARRSKQPVDSDNPYLARIWAKQVTPPHTVTSLKHCICDIERIPQAFIRGQLFSNILSESPMNEGRISILTSNGLGFKPEQPMAFIVPAIDLTFTSYITVASSWIPVQDDTQPRFFRFSSEYLSVTEDEILHTDGVLRLERRQRKFLIRLPDLYYPIAGESRCDQKVYLALNSKGNLGFIHQDRLKGKVT